LPFVANSRKIGLEIEQRIRGESILLVLAAVRRQLSL
jgi:hypothetical protein